MIRLLCDSSADIMPDEASEMGVEIISLRIQFEDRVYIQEQDTNFAEFYALQAAAKNLPKTSQATPEDFVQAFRRLGEGGHSVIAVTLSSGLSGTYQSALIAKDMVPEIDVHVVDSLSGIAGIRILLEKAVAMRDAGHTPQEIVDALLEVRPRIQIWAMVDTLTYLAKGGRLPKSVAFAGNLLGVKPIVTVMADGKLNMVSKARGYQAIMTKFAEGPEHDPAYPVYFGYTAKEEAGKRLMDAMCERFTLEKTGMYPIGPLIGTHLGPGCVSITYVLRDQERA